MLRKWNIDNLTADWLIIEAKPPNQDTPEGWKEVLMKCALVCTSTTMDLMTSISSALLVSSIWLSIRTPKMQAISHRNCGRGTQRIG